MKEILVLYRSGGTPYGASHVSGADGNPEPSDDEIRLPAAFGRRLASSALKLAEG
ncbi:hypothetical protein [Aromatoleum anaerobium]|uniref:hypothetical protein n=1 Tax=Aromatoleum anaerobium TaxID=182180 RepID=UPI003CCFEDEF